MAIEWNESMSTGVPEVDEEHKEWIQRFNNFDDAVINRLGMDVIHEALSFFGQYADTHFPHEDELSKHINTPAVEKNRSEHEYFRSRIKEIEEWIQLGGVSMVEVISLKTDMEEWLRNHICVTDIELFSGNKQVGDSSPKNF